MSGVCTVQDLNRELARKINEEACKDPQSPYANKFVGPAEGIVRRRHALRGVVMPRRHGSQNETFLFQSVEGFYS